MINPPVYAWYVGPTETFKCTILEVEDHEIHVESITSDGEEADAWLPKSSIDPWRRIVGEKFALNVYVPASDKDAVLHEYLWHSPPKRSWLNRQTLRTRVYPVILSVALGMLGGDTMGAGLTHRTWLYLAAIVTCWAGIFITRRRPRPLDTPPGRMRITSDD